MPKYNEKRPKVVKRTVSHEGGRNFTQTPEKELISILATGMSNTFYETEGTREKRFREVLEKIAKKNPLFAAKALIYARSVMGQRSVTHLGAVNLTKFLSGTDWGKKFFSKRNRRGNNGGIVYRLDDMAEILSCYYAKNGTNAPLSNAIKKGFKDAIENADQYELAKYQMKSRGVSLVDIVNLVHPKETNRQGFVDVPVADYRKAITGTKFKEDVESLDGNYRISTLRALVLGLLKQFNTVEDKNTKAGQEVANLVKSGELSKAQAEKVLTESKAANYADLIATKKIGYLALLRNMRNIIKTGDATLLNDACALLTNKEMIKKSLVWPHQIDLAMEVMLLEFSGRALGKVTNALSKAYELAIPNLEELFPEGETAIVYDTSGSMFSHWNSVKIPSGGRQASISKQPADKATLIAATLAKGVGADVYQVASWTEGVRGFNPNDSINTIKNVLTREQGRVGHGTEYTSVFSKFLELKKRYDRVIIIGDGQTRGDFVAAGRNYANVYGQPYVYYVDLCGYSSSPVKENNTTFKINGYGPDIYEHMKNVEIDVNAVIKAINEIEI